jgi:hypothetical protein
VSVKSKQPQKHQKSEDEDENEDEDDQMRGSFLTGTRRHRPESFDQFLRALRRLYSKMRQ